MIHLIHESPISHVYQKHSYIQFMNLAYYNQMLIYKYFNNL